jgi:hypothetical protein
MLSPLGFDLYDFGLSFNTFSIALNSMLWRALSSAEIYVIYVFHLEKSKSWGFTPHPTKEDCSSYPPWMLHDAPNGVESPLCSLANLLSLPKDASLHLRKLASHPWLDSRNLPIRPAATPRG